MQFMGGKKSNDRGKELDCFAHFGPLGINNMDVEFTGKFGEKSLDQLLCAAEHPWIEIKDGIAELFQTFF